MKFICTTFVSFALLTGNAFSQNLAEMMGKMGEKTNYENSYTFTNTATLEIISTEKGGKKSSSSVMDMASDKEQQAFCMEVISIDGKPQKERALMLFDRPNKTMLTLMTDSKGDRSGVAMAFDPEEIDRLVEDAQKGEAENGYQENVSFSKTGNTKQILGYTCLEYAFDTDETQGTAWITEDANINIMTFFGAMGQTKVKQKQHFSQIGGYPQGMLMEMKARDKKTNDTSEMRVTAIDLNASKSVAPPDYHIMSLSNMIGN